MKNIYLTGAHGTGKSTLVRALQEKLPDLQQMTDMSKLFLSVDTKNIQTDYDLEEFLTFQKRIFLWCAREYVFSENTVFSRSLVDSYAYMNYAAENTRNGKIRSELLTLIETIPLYIPETNGLYVYVPIEFELTSDGNPLRPLSRVYQRSIDKYIQSCLLASRIPYITVTGSVEDRVRTIMEAM